MMMSAIMQESSRAAPVQHDPQSQQTYQLAQRVAACNVAVLLSGESGTGKEVLARYIHDQSERRNQPFVAINCAAIPENMLEAILFGYEKGAFTGAHAAQPGRFERAQNGTLMLDEVSEMDLGLQAKLLRVLQEREVERLGGRQPIQLNIRIIAATNRCLKSEVQAGRFREDLYYRLNVFPLQLQPLRYRPMDIVPLARLFIRAFCQNEKLNITPELTSSAIQHLQSYAWPGNIRELQNVIQRGMVICNGEKLTEKDLYFDAAQTLLTQDDSVAGQLAACNRMSASSLANNVQKHEDQQLLDALHNAEGDRYQVAQQLQINPRTLRHKIARLRELGHAIPAVKRHRMQTA